MLKEATVRRANTKTPKRASAQVSRLDISVSSNVDMAADPKNTDSLNPTLYLETVWIAMKASSLSAY